MNTQTATEYRNLPLNVLTESTTNPRRVFEDAALKELAASIRVQGVLSPLLVRPITEQGFEIVAGARRYRAAQMANFGEEPVRKGQAPRFIPVFPARRKTRYRHLPQRY